MKLFRREEHTKPGAQSGQGRVIRRRPTFCAMEVKLLALEVQSQDPRGS